MRSSIPGQATWAAEAGTYADEERQVSLHSLFEYQGRQGKLVYAFSLQSLQLAENRSVYLENLSKSASVDESSAVDPPKDDQGGSPRPPEPRTVGYRAGISETVCQAEFTWPCEWATAVVGCESGGDWSVVGEEWYNGELWYFIGGWQIAVKAVSYNANPEAYAYLFDPYQNTVEAHIKYTTQGIGAWPNCG